MSARTPTPFHSCDIRFACVLLSAEPADIEAMLDEGRITCAWNISCKPTGRRTLRFLTEELHVLAAGRAFELAPAHLPEKLFGAKATFVDGKTFRQAFNCDSDHVLNLIRAGQLAVLPGTGWHRGPHGTPAITWASAVRFITTRRIAD